MYIFDYKLIAGCLWKYECEYIVATIDICQTVHNHDYISYGISTQSYILIVKYADYFKVITSLVS